MLQQIEIVDTVRSGHHPGHQELTFNPARAPLSVGTDGRLYQ